MKDNFIKDIKTLLDTSKSNNMDWFKVMINNKKSILIDNRYIVNFPDYSKDIFVEYNISQLFPGISFIQDIVIIDKKSSNGPFNAKMIITYHYDLDSFSTCIKTSEKVMAFQTAEIYE